MINIPIDAKVECTDGSCGKSTHVIVNPVNLKVTHFALKEKSLPDNPTRLVPVSKVSEATPKKITLSISKAEVARMSPFIVKRFVAQSSGKDSGYNPEQVYHCDYILGGTQIADAEAGSPYSASQHRGVQADYVISGKAYDSIDEEQVPKGELSIHSGMHIHATDGRMGRLDTLVLDPDTGEITYLMMREGHLWGKKNIAIPIAAVDYTDADEIHVNLDKDTIDNLPNIKT
jgi:hypothetical protein